MKEKCYIYTRVSTLKQVEGYSLEAQNERLYAFARYKGLEIVGEYCDAGRSGHSIKSRPQFTKMLDDIVEEKDGIRFVLVFKLSRFGRNAADVLKTMQLLSDYDIDLVSVDDAIDSSTQSGRLTLSILSAVAEVERENIRVQLNAGYEQMLRGGGFPGGPVPFGYRKAREGLAVFEPEATVVRMMYRHYLGEKGSITSVTNYLNENGYVRETKDGERPFTTSFVKEILRRPVYAGKYIHNLRSATGRPVYEVKGCHEALVSEDDWTAVQVKMSNMAEQHKRRGHRFSLLAGLLRCPMCGGPMVSIGGGRDINSNHGGYYKPFYAYGCGRSSKQEGRRCSFRHIYGQEKTDSAVYEMVCRLEQMPEFTEAVERRILTKKSSEECKAAVKRIRKEIMSLETMRRNTGREIDGLNPLDEGYMRKFAKLQEKTEKIYDRLDVLEDALVDAENEKELAEQDSCVREEAVRFVEDFPAVFEKMTREERREYFRIFIDQIEVFPEKQEDGRILKSISFKIPVSSAGKGEPYREKKTPVIGFEVDCRKAGLTAAEASATYKQIKEFVLERHEVKVSSLYIGQIKTKYGLYKRKNYNVSKKHSRVPTCPVQKERYIVEALQHFQMLGNDVEVMV